MLQRLPRQAQQQQQQPVVRLQCLLAQRLLQEQRPQPAQRALLAVLAVHVHAALQAARAGAITLASKLTADFDITRLMESSTCPDARRRGWG
jgi:hypothetical protein